MLAKGRGGEIIWEVGVILEVGGNTVNFHLKNAMRKLEVTSRIQWAVKARRLKLIERRMADTVNPCVWLRCRAVWKTAPSASRGIVPSSDTEERANEAGTNH
ncbi:helix-turn-helix transcriptional regulator [Bradyrhizobium sp. RT9b]|uniref:helix-turn-helix transcriptional regulator n=1 Tax=Bradyrhizobium sp. RT9b TaxID=3156385 RepID=UPI00339978A5